jgi:hypothetical protein
MLANTAPGAAAGLLVGGAAAIMTRRFPRVVRRGRKPPPREMRRLLFYSGLLTLASLLSLAVAGVPPQFGKDAQFYVQAGPLWAAGKVTFGGSLIGQRHLAVLAYHLPRLFLWNSIDALSVTLGVVFFAFGLSVALLARCVVGLTAAGFAAAAGSMLIAFVAPLWTSPATDNLFLLVVVVALLLYALLLRTRRPAEAFTFVALVGAWCGTSMGIRSEALLVFVACAATLIAPLPAWPRLRQRVLGVLLAGLCFAAADAAQSASFRLWTGVAKPAQLNGFFLFYQTANALDPAAGPASARLHAILRSAERELAEQRMSGLVDPRFRAVGVLYEHEGAEAASDLFCRAGVESLMAHPGRIIADTLANVRSYLTEPKGELKIDRRGHDARRRETLRQLAIIDAIRVKTSALFAHDAHWPVVELARGAPVYRLDWPHPAGNLPAWAFTAMLVGGAGYVLTRRRWSSILAVTVGLVVTLMLLTAFSQGLGLRYWLSWTVLLTVACLIELAGAVSRGPGSLHAAPAPLGRRADADAGAVDAARARPQVEYAELKRT